MAPAAAEAMSAFDDASSQGEASRVRPTGRWHWLGRRPFPEVAGLQERLRRGVLDATTPETVLFVEHDPVITLGRSANAAHVIATPETLAREGVAIAPATRGGDVTYHGPGQLVGYPIVRLRRGVLAHVEAMAQAVIEVLANFGVPGWFRRDVPGVWVKSRRGDAKICAIGVAVHHRVAVHGFAFNLAPDLRHFGLIVPCGLTDAHVTSLAEVTGVTLDPRDAAPIVASALERSLGMTLTPCLEAP